MRRDFIANAAHELRTPLTNLQGYLEALRDGVIDRRSRDLRLAAGTRRSVSSGCRIRSTRWPRATPRRRHPRLEELDLAAAIRAALDLAQPVLERAQLHLVVDIPAATAGPCEPGRARPGPGQSHLQRRPLHAGRRHGRRSAPSVARPTCWSRSRTPATASHRPISSASSNVSTGSRSRAIGRAAAPASGSPSSSNSSRPGGGRVGAESGDGQTRFWFSLPA